MPTTTDIHEFIKRHDKHDLFDDQNPDVNLYGDEYRSGFIANRSEASDIQKELEAAFGSNVKISISDDRPNGPVQIVIDAKSLAQEYAARNHKQADVLADIRIKMDENQKRLPAMLAPGAKGEGLLKREQFMLSPKQVNAVRSKQLQMSLENIQKKKSGEAIDNVQASGLLLTSENTPELGPNDPIVMIGDNHEAIVLCEQLLLGEGGFGKVYLGQSLDTGDFCVIKELTAEGDKATFEFEHENQTLDELNLLIDTMATFHQGQDKKYSVQPLAWGQDFEQHLKADEVVDDPDGVELYARYDEYPFDERLEMYIQALEKIQAMHVAGWIHRDIKAANVVWDPQTRQARLVDMGMAEKMDDRGWVIDNRVLGTPQAIDPELIKEQIDGFEKTYSTKTDAYAAGVLGLELFSRETVYFGPDLLVPNIQDDDGNLLDDGLPRVFELSSTFLNDSDSLDEHQKQVSEQLKGLLEINPEKRSDLKTVIDNLNKIQQQMKADANLGQNQSTPTAAPPTAATPDLDLAPLVAALPPTPPAKEQKSSTGMLQAFDRQTRSPLQKYATQVHSLLDKENRPENLADRVADVTVDLKVAQAKGDYSGKPFSPNDKQRAKTAFNIVVDAVQHTRAYQKGHSRIEAPPAKSTPRT